MNETQTKTKNQELVRGLREMADFIESNPDLPWIDFAITHKSYYQRREEFMQAVRALGACTKEYDDHNITVTRKFSGDAKLSFSLNRDAVCKKIVTWDCGDASLLKELGLDEAGNE